ncbi:hypothetical protein IJ472_00230 [bacterium]|nr:hypothetical protein [bacterium]
MKKSYIFGTLVGIILILFFTSILYSLDRHEEQRDANTPRIGKKMWTYNMNKYEWRKYSENDSDTSKEEIVLQVMIPDGKGEYDGYYLLTDNAQVPKENVWIGESSQEFLRNKKLYSFFPRHYEFYEVIFNGVKFVPRKLEDNEIKTLFKGYEIIKISELKKGILEIPYSKRNNQFILINDIGEDFYKYYIVPNDSKKLQLGEFSNQFKVTDKVDIKIQRLEGCTKAYPCFEINIK